MGALNYNEHKVKNGKAALIHSTGFTKDTGRLTFTDKLKQLQDLAAKNTRVVTNAVHISLNFDKEDVLDEDKLTEIASSYMEKIGFGNQPYLVYQHFDAAHTHIHIVTTNIQNDGSRISLHNLGKNQSEKARKEIEKDFGLVKAESKRKDQKEFIHPIDVKQAIYGKSETKRSISNVVGMVTRTYKYTSLPELNAVLKSFNVIADRGKEGSAMHVNKGLVYSLLDEKRNKIGIPIKASSIYGKPTLAFLKKQFRLNDALRKPHKNQLKQAIDGVLQYGPRDVSALVKLLDKKGIQTVIRENAEGRIYGITFVDHRTKCVFNGSDLGKQYSANGIVNRLSEKRQVSKQFRPGYSEVKKSANKELKDKANPEKTDLSLNRMVDDLTKAESHEYLSPEAAMKLRRKKKRRKGQSL